MPLTSMMPMLFRAPAPGPVARTSGKCPKTVAAVVIRIGRKPRARRSRDCLEFAQAGFLQMIREFHDQNSVLRDQADESDQSHLAVDIQRRETQERKHQRARDGQRNRAGENDEGIAEALELRRQHQIDENR